VPATNVNERNGLANKNPAGTSLENDQQMRQGTSWIYYYIPDLPKHVAVNLEYINNSN
jgi:hypothetical protein